MRWVFQLLGIMAILSCGMPMQSSVNAGTTKKSNSSVCDSCKSLVSAKIAEIALMRDSILLLEGRLESVKKELNQSTEGNLLQQKKLVQARDTISKQSEVIRLQKIDIRAAEDFNKLQDAKIAKLRDSINILRRSLAASKKAAVKQISEKTSKEANKKSSDAIRVIWHGATYDVFTVRYPQAQIRIVLNNDKGEHLRSLENTVQYFNGKKTTLSFAMNAGMFDDNNNPVGLYIASGQKLSDIDRKTEGYGNFYLQPNGIFAVTTSKAFIVSTADYHDRSDIQFATQSGPMLVTNGTINSNFKEGSSNKYIRNGVGIQDDGTVIFVISNQPVNFYEFASLFLSKLNCKMALYLDGTISKAYIPQLKRFDQNGDLGPIITVAER